MVNYVTYFLRTLPSFYVLNDSLQFQKAFSAVPL